MKNQSTTYYFPVILLRLFGQKFMEFLTCRKKGLSRLWIIACCGGNTTEAVTKPSPFLLHGAFRKFVISWSLKADQRIQMELWVRLLVFFQIISSLGSHPGLALFVFLPAPYLQTLASLMEPPKMGFVVGEPSFFFRTMSHIIYDWMQVKARTLKQKLW